MTHSLPGAFIISLDFELHWGVRDSSRPGYESNLLGARTVVPRLLALFAEYGIAATWATVGFLFAASRKELESFHPARRPVYVRSELSSYAEICGPEEASDPLHFAPSLIRRIHETGDQEIGTHTYSHYFCTEEGQSREDFAADLSAARAIAEPWGIRLRSIVFPRNQHNPAYDDVLLEHGIVAYRGNVPAGIWQFGRGTRSGRTWKRAARYVDAYANVSGDNTFGWDEILQPNGLANIRASAMLRPYHPRAARLEGRRLDRVLGGLRAAARERRLYHLWWHPHNFGVHQDENLAFLRRVLEEVDRCRGEHGLLSLGMAGAADLARSA